MATSPADVIIGGNPRRGDGIVTPATRVSRPLTSECSRLVADVPKDGITEPRKAEETMISQYARAELSE